MTMTLEDFKRRALDAMKQFERAHGIFFAGMPNLLSVERGRVLLSHPCGAPAVAIRAAFHDDLRNLMTMLHIPTPGESDFAPRMRQWVFSLSVLTGTLHEKLSSRGMVVADIFRAMLGVHLALCDPQTMHNLLCAKDLIAPLWPRGARLMERYSVAWRLLLLLDDADLGIDPHINRGRPGERALGRAGGACRRLSRAGCALRCWLQFLHGP
jgi:hypothetical protein